ncbi:SDR family NAD(P)-dependent oxidoreductase [Simiduia litorea]|uniref:SDR family NAD(P)-dependent oxidoreductase n=1 Tax=Simiduia litorea TaxID=1435348 RepID=UPI0036F2F2CF
MITGKIIWLTGASSGIGRALLVKLLRAGNQVIASARSADAFTDIKAEFPHLLTPLACDVGNAESMAAAKAELHAITDSLDMVILNAGCCEYVDLPVFEPKLFERVFATNFQGVVNCLAIALPLLRANTHSNAQANTRSRAQVVAVSSLSTLLPFPRAEAYGASKAALDYFIATLRIDLKAANIDVTLVQPGFVATPLTAKNDFPMPGLIASGRAADEIIWASEKRKKLHRFPRRLAWPLLVLRSLGPVWERWLAPALIRKPPSLY